ncbi:oxidoreductase [Allostella sp. ATCC 35155]|nr:oxidoreductase [Stella sp. ATCC 35155]
MLDPETTRQSDLRGGEPPWRDEPHFPPPRPLAGDGRCGVLVVGAGITGALAAQHLAASGHDVLVLDRGRPGFGSTAASTAMLQWEIDRPLTELADLYGFARAARVYRRSFAAADGLCGLIDDLGLDCGMRRRRSVFLAADTGDVADLEAEHALRRRAGLPGSFLDHGALRDAFGFDRPAAIVAPGSADADPLQLSLRLLRAALAAGARLHAGDAVAYEQQGRSVLVGCADGRVVEAGHVVLATGYVMPDFVPGRLHRLVSSWALATPRQAPGQLWRERALVWEAGSPYLYARTTPDDRIVVGGEDDERMVEPADRERASSAKTAVLLAKLRRLWPAAEARADHVWSGVFGTTADGLPLIGPVPDRPRVIAAYGYGGNGITFSFLASRMIRRLVAGGREPWFDDFALDRDGA